MAYRTGSELKGLAVLTLTGGRRLGRVHDVVFLPDGRITGFLLAADGGGLFLPAERVHGLGEDALTVESEEGLLPEREMPAGAGEYPARSLHGRPLIAEAGTALGKVADIGVDTSALRVTALLMTTSLLDSLLHHLQTVPLDAVRAIGEHSVIVTDAAVTDAAVTDAAVAGGALPPPVPDDRDRE